MSHEGEYLEHCRKYAMVPIDLALFLEPDTSRLAASRHQPSPTLNPAECSRDFQAVL
jgi:hypothetical protein